METNASLRALEHRNTEESYWDDVRRLAVPALPSSLSDLENEGLWHQVFARKNSFEGEDSSSDAFSRLSPTGC